MPCRDDCPTEDSYSVEARVRAELEPLLCEACTLLEDRGALITTLASNELLVWYQLHTADESDRLRYEAALKLSERERKLLGLDLAQLKIKAGKRCK